jgi:tetratricopeptide (TPR) repeat protein
MWRLGLRQIPFSLIPLLLLSLLCSMQGIEAHADDLSRRIALVPADVAESYFPGGDRYLIPESDRTETLIARAREYEAAGSLQQAKKLYASAFRRAQGTPAAAYILFKQCTIEEDAEGALSCLSGIIDSYPEFPLIDAVRFEMAFRYYLGGRQDLALQYLSEILESERDGAPVLGPSALMFSGIIQGENGMYEEGLGLLSEALEAMGPGGGAAYEEVYTALYLERAKMLIALGDLEDAEDLLLRLYGTASSVLRRSESLWYMAQLFSLQNNATGAYTAYDLLVREYPETPFSVQAKARLGEMQGLTAGALEGIYDESLKQGLYGITPGAEFIPEQEEPIEQKRSYAVQIGSFSRKENAQAQVKRLTELGFSAYFVQAQIDGKEYFRVRIGPYLGKAEALSALEMLEDRGESGFLVRVE